MTLKRKLALGTSALAALAFAGGAYAATQESGSTSRQAFVDDVAKRLNVSPSQLRTALQGAFQDQLQAAVAAGRITQAQANAIKQHEQQRGTSPRRGWQHFAPAGGRMFGGPAFGALPAAASYLGLSRAQLLEQLAAGKSLAQLAAARGKSVAGLEQAITAATRARLDKLLAAKLITSAQEQQLLSGLASRLPSEINRTGLSRFGMRPWLGAARPAAGMANGRAMPGAPVVAGAPQAPAPASASGP